MKVSVLCHDLSHNGFSRAWLLAKMIARGFEVDIVGLEQGNGIWPPLKVDDQISIKCVSSSLVGLTGVRTLSKLRSLVDGDVVYACKPQLGSYGVGLLKTIGTPTPLLLDIDDRDLFLQKIRKSLTLGYLADLRNIWDGNTSYYLRLMESLCGIADARTVTTPALQQQFGGELLPQVCDTGLFDPDRFDQERVREELELPTDKTIVIFPGTPRLHKGLDDFATALARLDRDDIEGIVVGALDKPITYQLLGEHANQVSVYGSRPYEEMPAWIAAADMVVVPQKASFQFTRYQFPMKIVVAMAMGTPIITTDIPILSSVVDGCGLVVPSECPAALAQAIATLSTDPTLRESLGRTGRARCIDRFSLDANTERVIEMIHRAARS